MSSEQLGSRSRRLSCIAVVLTAWLALVAGCGDDHHQVVAGDDAATDAGTNDSGHIGRDAASPDGSPDGGDMDAASDASSLDATSSSDGANEDASDDASAVLPALMTIQIAVA